MDWPWKKAKDPADPRREQLRKHLVQRFYVRFHMSLILFSCFLAGMLANSLMLAIGISWMWLRYPLAVGVAYGAFIGGIWLWRKYLLARMHKPADDRTLDLSTIPDVFDTGSSAGRVGDVMPRGGNFGGGGSSHSWAESASNAQPRMPNVQSVQTSMDSSIAEAAPSDLQAAPESGGGGGGGGGGGSKLEALGAVDDGVLLVLAIAVIVAIVFASGYTLWAAPDIITEAVFGGALAGSLAKTAAREDAHDWVEGVVRKTWWPFAIVSVCAWLFGAYAGSEYPGARTMGEAFAAAAAKNEAEDAARRLEEIHGPPKPAEATGQPTRYVVPPTEPAPVSASNPAPVAPPASNATPDGKPADPAASKPASQPPR
jgi:hypothetical protein